MTTPRVPFMRLVPGNDRPAIDAAIRRVVERGWYVLGPEVDAFENAFAGACGAAHAIGVGTGTDAIAIILRGLGIGAGDDVITTPVSAAYTALACMMVGARPVFADIDPRRLTIDPAAIEAAITPRTAAVLPVHLYGQPADMRAIMAVATARGLAVVEDCCQAHLATCDGRPVGSFGVASAYSFYPTKNLGALGDGGAITTNDEALAAKLRRIRNGGQTDRYHHGEMGVNSRLDDMQAAILSARLPLLAGWTAARRAHAAAYRQLLAGSGVEVPPECDAGHVYHLFPVLSPRRDDLQAALRADGIETLIHYPVPIPNQPALRGQSPGACPEADRVCAHILSLPMYPDIGEEDLRTVAGAIRRLTA
ncbi:MAG TPA: DegT/DnrJ/EryC1/StrS family aminotransferase [Vicinamibacterales bacterium]|nr:DegT/DnrJ/EryC1/StrS family aminotransferase [Vicinamibacterales bacterium]